MTPIRSVRRSKGTAITAKNSSEKESTLSLASLRKSSDTTSEQASKSSSISSRFTGLLNYFSNDYWCPRRNSENTTQSSETGFSIETESASASSGSKENQIPDKLNQNIQSENHSSKTPHSARVVNKKYIGYTGMVFASLGLLYAIDLNNKFFQYKNGKDPDQKGSNNLHKATPLPRPGSLYELPEFSGELEGSLTYPMSPGELELIRNTKILSDNFEYLKNQADRTVASTDEQSSKIDENNSLLKQMTAFMENFSKHEKNSIINKFSILYTAVVFTLGGLIFSNKDIILDYLTSKFFDTKDYIIKIFQSYCNDHASEQLPTKNFSGLDLSGGQSSCSSTESASPSLRRVSQSPNGTENFTGHSIHNR